MPRTTERGGPRTRERIADAAIVLFLERGFDAVTVAEVARAAGVSSVTVFNHFPRKEDLFLDRGGDAIELLRATLRDRGADVTVTEALRVMTMRLVDGASALSGADPRSVPFFRTVAASPALVARTREIAGNLQRILAEELERDPSFEGDSSLLAAFFVAGYASVLVGTARRLIAGASFESVQGENRARFERLFDALRSGVEPRD